ncbi:MAG: stage V sporulation protein E [Parcubacteria group bacterium GW2011_GWA1_47_8]|nr:MAG: stage V sporulation protein E [Parcubacteria group bacterium GW2011_GWA1_47_8]KKW07719.1 MAG: stage V sporulation protein E [Parcubacteria group bacterium GW2011_GWA2_49_16]
MKSKKVDTMLLSITILLVSTGLFVFTSASFGLFARKGFSLYSLLFDQVVLGLLIGGIALVVALKVPLSVWRKYSLHLFIGASILTLFVFVPYIGFSHGGASRWISIGSLSLQPSEFLKLGVVVYCAALLPLLKERMRTFSRVFPLILGVMVVPTVILIAEPDTGTLAVTFSAVIAMFLAAGMKFRHLLVMIAVAMLALGTLAMFQPYVKERVLTFFDPSRDPQGSGYQIQKSFLAVGSGGIMGRGFGQSIQKYGSLPEPTGDSIFAVVGEEFGFVGGTLIIILFLLFGIRGIQIARLAPDAFSGLLAVGIVILIISQSFANIASTLGVVPFTGVPLVFVSHGGTALIAALLEIGILLNISKFTRSTFSKQK